MNQFGPIINASMVEDAVLAHCRKWLPTYIREIERQSGMEPGKIALPQSYVVVDDVNATKTGLKQPICAAICSGTSDYAIQGSSEYVAWFDAGIAIKFVSTNNQALRRRVNMYNAAARASIVQHPSLDGFAEGCIPVSEQYDEEPGAAPNNATYAYAMFEFKVKVVGIVDRFEGPIAPIVEPIEDPGNWPTVDDVQITIEQKDVANEL